MSAWRLELAKLPSALHPSLQRGVLAHRDVYGDNPFQLRNPRGLRAPPTPRALVRHVELTNFARNANARPDQTSPGWH